MATKEVIWVCQHDTIAHMPGGLPPVGKCKLADADALPCYWERKLVDVEENNVEVLGVAGATIDEGQQAIFFPLPKDPVQRDLTIWWMQTAHYDLEKQLPKMYEYGGNLEAQLAAEQEPSGSADLTMMGWAITTLLRWSDHDSPVALELAVWFYILGKVARLISDYQRQVPGKPDTWHDITVYSMMGRRIQEHGRWP